MYGLTAIIFAALGGHILGIDSTNPYQLLFNNAVLYQLLHAILLIGLCFIIGPDFWIKSSLIAFTFGILFFCGGLFLLIIYGKTKFSFVTPVGGSFLILGWLNLSISGFIKFYKSKD